jgi:hypothetical protein
MTKNTALTLSAIAFCSLIPAATFATQPPDVVNSDLNYNTAMGSFALYSLGSGNGNTAAGAWALEQTTSGVRNSALGMYAMYGNTTGSNNVGVGGYALSNNTTGYYNAAVGDLAMGGNTTGIENTSVGFESLEKSNGVNNIAIGYQAGFNLTIGSNNIDIGYGSSSLGDSSESNTIRIGTPGTQTATYLAGISGTQVTGAAVYVTSSGQLGVLASSERYKTDVATMRDETGKLEQLRPVTFKLKTDPKGVVQYGLIAEEVDKVFPELVIHNGDGRIEGVRYEELAPMLLKQIQLQQKEISELRQQLADVTELKAQVAALMKRGSSVEPASLLQASR